MKNILIVFFCLLISSLQQAAAQCPPAVHIGIDSVTTTESRCQSTGTATVYASNGAAPYTYSIISGPVTAPAQSGNTFQSLAPGSYVVQVTDNCNQSSTQSFSIAGTYSVPNPTATFEAPRCQGSNDGKLTVNVANGRSPFSYSLISPSPVTAGPQASNAFSNLPAGNYTYQVTDSCGNFQTRTVTLPDGDNSSQILVAFTYKWLACDSFQIAYILIPLSTLKMPYTNTLKKANGDSIVHVLDSSAMRSGTIYDTFTVHIPFGQTYTLKSVNACGIAYNTSGHIYTPLYAFASGLTGCSSYKYVFDAIGDFAHGALCPSATYTLVSPTGTVLEVSSTATFQGYPPGSGYKVILNDCCFSDSITFDWATPPPLTIQGIQIDKACKENQASLIVQFGNVSSPVSLIFKSGPASVTFTDGTTRNYQYPDTIKRYVQGINYPYAIGSINYLTPGTYAIQAIDTCGHVIDTNFTVTPAMVRHATFSTTVKRDCTNGMIVYTGTDDKITWSNPMSYVTLNEASGNTDPYYFGTYFKIINGAPFPATTTTYKDSIINLSAGTYYVHYHYSTNLSSIGGGNYAPLLPDDNHYGDTLAGIGYQNCDIFTDTIVMPAYVNPFFATPPALAVCNGNRNVALLPDTTTGVQPYRYQITSGPVTTGLQSSPVFANLPQGTYTFQMSDTCGNSYSSSVSIDTLIMPQIVTTGNTCPGGTAVFTAPGNPYYKYKWRRPNGTTDTAHAITVSPVTNADTGTYVVTVTSTINGCTDSAVKSLVLNFCVPLPVDLFGFSGRADHCDAVLSWTTADEQRADHFEVQYSNDGRVFTPIGTIQSKGGSQTYRYVAAQHNDKGLYRLSCVYKDGSSKLSSTVTVQTSCGNDRSGWHLYPNPAGGSVNITGPATDALITVLNIYGQPVITNEPLSNQVLNIKDLLPGLYTVQIRSGGTLVSTLKLVKQ